MVYLQKNLCSFPIAKIPLMMFVLCQISVTLETQPCLVNLFHNLACSRICNICKTNCSLRFTKVFSLFHFDLYYWHFSLVLSLRFVDPVMLFIFHFILVSRLCGFFFFSSSFE